MDIQKPDISSLIENISNGVVVLPDFQRDFVWKPDDVQDLLVSVLADFYIGTMLVIDDVRDEASFRLRRIEGIDPSVKIPSIVKILLDGQQRCSSLYYALKTPPVPLYGRKNPTLFYCNIEKALSEDWENTVETVHTGNKRTLRAVESDKNFIPMSMFLDTTKLVDFLRDGGNEAKLAEILNIVNRFNAYQVQMVELKRDTPLDRVVEVFERINRTGLPLNITDLLVARLFKSDIQLRELINVANELFGVFSGDNQVDIEFALRVMCIVRGHPIKKKSILELDPERFEEDWSTACEYLDKAFDRITNPIGGYGAVDFRRFVPFRTMIVPLAAMLWTLERDKIGHDTNLSKLDQWYWVSVFGNRYNEAVNTTTITDFDRMKAWFKDDTQVPEFISRFNVDTVDFRTSSKSSSTYRGVLNLVVLNGAKDFQNGKDPFANKMILEDDHIFPKSIYNDNEITNRTLIASNAEKSNKQPNQYFAALETLSSRSRMEEIMATHLVDANAYSSLLANELDQFKRKREAVIRAEIKARTPSAKGLSEDEGE